jgi:Holliday junction resolvase RusA-like endonuclease
MCPDTAKPSVTFNPYRLSIFLDFLPDIQLNNSHGHWATKYQKIRKTKATVGFSVFEHRPPKPLETARLTLVRHSTREPDFDNMVASFKPVIDALTEYQIIVNDRPDNIGQPSYNWVKCARVNQGISILVEEVSREVGGRA